MKQAIANCINPSMQDEITTSSPHSPDNGIGRERLNLRANICLAEEVRICGFIAQPA